MNPFDKFERNLKSELAEARRAGLIIDADQDQPERRRGRPKLDRESHFKTAIQIPAIVGEQLDEIGNAYDISRAALARMVLGAGLKALIEHLEDGDGGISLPLMMKVAPSVNAPRKFFRRVITGQQIGRLQMGRNVRA